MDFQDEVIYEDGKWYVNKKQQFCPFSSASGRSSAIHCGNWCPAFNIKPYKNPTFQPDGRRYIQISCFPKLLNFIIGVGVIDG